MGNWSEMGRKNVAALHNAGNRVGNEVVRQTYGRPKVAEAAEGWDFLKIVREMREIALLFLRHNPVASLCGRITPISDGCAAPATQKAGVGSSSSLSTGSSLSLSPENRPTFIGHGPGRAVKRTAGV